MKKLFSLLFCSLLGPGCASRLSKNDLSKRYDILVESSIKSHLEKMFPENKFYWATWAFTEAKNGDPLHLLKYEVSDKPNYISGIRDSAIVQSEGFVLFKQEEKEIKLKCRFVLESKEGSLQLMDSKIIHRTNPDCGSFLMVTNQDPLKSFRKTPKTLKAINNRTVYVGMPEDALILSLGELVTNINETNYLGQRTKQYVLPNNSYIYVKSGKVIATQNY